VATSVYNFMCVHVIQILTAVSKGETFKLSLALLTAGDICLNLSILIMWF